MNDIYAASDKFQAVIYADDTNLYSTLCSFNVDGSSMNPKLLSQNINKELADICEWLSINKLSLNVKKTKYMIFHYRQRDISNIILNLKINDYQIDRVHDFNFLGLTIDEHVSWKEHIQKVSTKISRTIGVLTRLKKTIPSYILRLLYNSLVLPYLQYGILIWGFKPGRLITLQKKAIRTILNSKYNAHTEPLFKQLNLLKLQDIFQCCALRFGYKLFNESLPQYYISMFNIDYSRHAYSTRESSKISNSIARCRTKTSSAQDCIRHYLPCILDQTPPFISDKIFTHSYQGFCNYIKNYVISKYELECTIENCYICAS